MGWGSEVSMVHLNFILEMKKEEDHANPYFVIVDDFSCLFCAFALKDINRHTQFSFQFFWGGVGCEFLFRFSFWWSMGFFRCFQRAEELTVQRFLILAVSSTLPCWPIYYIFIYLSNIDASVLTIFFTNFTHL